MKGTYLGEFQEIVLLTILILEENAYGVSIQEEINTRIQRNISRGALHTALKRLEEKGFISSRMGEATAVRGGRRKRLYTVTNRGKESLQTAKEIRDQLWQAIPKLNWRSF
ncbi:MAG: helix-turn-helix transcriptional regulator [Bacteroidota bacterium]